MRKLAILIVLVIVTCIPAQGVSQFDACRCPQRVVEIQDIYPGQIVKMCNGQILQLEIGEIYFEITTWPSNRFIMTRETIESVLVCAGDRQCGIKINKTIPRYFAVEVGNFFDINNDYVFEIIKFGYGYVVFQRLH